MKMFKLASKITGILTAAAMLCSSTLVASAADSSSTQFYRSLGYTDSEIATISSTSLLPSCYFVYVKAGSGLANSTGSVTTSMTYNSNYFTYDGVLTSSLVTGTPSTSTNSINPSGWFSNTTSCNYSVSSYTGVMYRMKLTAVASQRASLSNMYRNLDNSMSAVVTKPTVTLAYKDGTQLSSSVYDTYFVTEYSTNDDGTGARHIVAVGDVDFDGYITDDDRQHISNHVAGDDSISWSYKNFLAADANFNGSIDIADIVKVGRVLSGDLTTFW